MTSISATLYAMTRNDVLRAVPISPPLTMSFAYGSLPFVGRQAKDPLDVLEEAEVT